MVGGQFFNKSIVNHEICAHVFGGVSSPSRSNYALRKTASENQQEYGNDAAETLRKLSETLY